MRSVTSQRLAGALLSGATAAVGVGAHFYLILILAIVQSFLNGAAPHADDTGSEHLMSAWTLTIFVLITALMLVALSFLARWSWPVLPEKGILYVLLWLLVSAILGGLGVCPCCGSGSDSACGSWWPRQLFSLAWMLALGASFGVDARLSGVRAASLVVTIGFSVLVVTAPFNPCHWLPEVSWLMFARVTLFHLIWYANRLVRIAESTLYALYLPHVVRLEAARTGSTEADVPHMVPMDILSAWRVLATLAVSLNAPVHFRDRLVRPAASVAATAQKRLYQSIVTAQQAMPRLHAATFDGTEGAGAVGAEGMPAAPTINWKFRDYSHKYMVLIDVVRSVWVLGVCAPYTLVAFLELAWLAAVLHDACVELASVLRDMPSLAPPQPTPQ